MRRLGSPARPGLYALAAVAGLAVPVLAAVLVRRRFALVDVVGPSMLPTLSPGDRVLVRRAGLAELRRGQVVVLEKPAGDGTWPGPPPHWPPDAHGWMIKRVAAVPGEIWASPAPVEAIPAETVPDGALVVLGDNPGRSYDSRQLGYFPGERLLGVVHRPVRRAGPRPARA